MTNTYYDVLGVSPSADQDAIDRAYRERVKETHPDQNDDPNAAQQFLTVKEAHDVLSDPEERERYDSLGHDEYLAGGAGTASDDTQDAYSDAGDAGASGGSTGSTATGGVDWTANTRGSDAAARAWSDSGTTDAATAGDSTDTAKRLAAYALVAVPLGLASPVLFSSLLGLVADTQAEAPVSTTPAVIGLVVVVGLLFVGVVTVAERIADTDRRLLDKLGGFRPQ